MQSRSLFWVCWSGKVGNDGTNDSTMIKKKKSTSNKAANEIQIIKMNAITYRVEHGSESSVTSRIMIMIT